MQLQEVQCYFKAYASSGWLWHVLACKKDQAEYTRLCSELSLLATDATLGLSVSTNQQLTQLVQRLSADSASSYCKVSGAAARCKTLSLTQ